MKGFLNFLRRFITLSEGAYFLLIYLSMYAVLLGIELVVRGTSVEVLRILILLGILTGWLLARTKVKFWLAALLSLLLGFSLTSIHVSGLGAAIADLLGASLRYLWRLAFNLSPDPAQLAWLVSVIQARFQEALINLSLWTGDLLSGFMTYNQISTLLSWGWILWTFSSWFAWTTYRERQPIWGILPAGTMLAIMMTYTLEKRISLVLLLGAGLILIGLVNHDLKQSEWQEKGIKGTEAIRDRVYLAVVGFALYTMAFAGIMPSIRISPIADRFEELVYGSEEGEGSDGTGGSIEVGGFSSELYSIQRFAGLPRQKLIGSGPELAKRVVMIVSFPTVSFVGSELPNAARYWRSYTYDQYTGTGWQSSPTVEVSYQPGQEITGVYTNSVEVVTQEFRLSNAVRGTLFSAGSPVTLDHEVLVSWRSIIEEANNGNGHIVGMEDIFAVTLDSILYQVRSLVPTATDEDLRAADGEYPEWVRSRYLELPETVPQRVWDLAAEITAGQPTFYDQAKAIERFLRTYPYTLELPAPPADRDVADYFLFELQTGYCDYYATAMVVLARAVGLPARAVVGYVGGQYEQDNDYYLVSEADAHTWVEIYFNGYGWIPFEPTAARSLIDDEELALPLPPELVSLPQAAGPEERSDFPWWELGLAMTAAAAVVLVLWNRADLVRLRRMDGNSLVLVVYQRLYRYGRWMGLGHSRADTLFEFHDKLSRVLQTLAASPRRGKRLEGGIGQLRQLTDYAVRANFSSQALGSQNNDQIVRLWISLRAKLRYGVWRGILRGMREKLSPLKMG